MCNLIGYKIFCLDDRLHSLKLQVCFNCDLNGKQGLLFRVKKCPHAGFLMK